MFMDNSLYINVNQLLVATKEQRTFDPSLASQTSQQQQQLGIYQEEESVDFSALVDACEKTTFDVPSSGNTTAGGPLSSSSFFAEAPSDSAFPFDIMPGLSVYNSESNGFQSPQPIAEFPAVNQQPPQPHQTTRPPAMATPNPLHHVPVSMVKSSPKPSGGKAPKKAVSKDSIDYREKRDRNNVAVRKSRIKSKQRVQETEKRVKELEEENGQLQNKIALLTKELNVLKGLFASAGVPHPPIKTEMDVLGGGRMSD